jgi:hypothetical protein
MADMLSGCYECSRNCINSQFCDRESYVSLPKQLKIRVIANPTFWGFNDGSGNVLTSGTAIFSNGHYDFFDGYDELHFATKQCGEDGPILGPFRDEQRPDVLYRSVYDPDDPTSDEFSGLKHYNGATRDDIERGGAEVYLIDRAGTATSDLESCDQSDPTKVYKKFPENFGYGTKISTTDTIFKNKTGAWRYISQDVCYDNIYMNSGVVSECDGSPKQEILRGDNFGSEYDPFQIRVSGERGCVQDGSIPSLYKGEAYVYRSGGIEDFLHLGLIYNSGVASGIADGMALGVYGSYLDGGYRVFGVTHSSGVTDCKVVGTLGSGEVLETGHRWSALGTSDPNTCCGGAAHNISNDTKRANSVKNYHSDLGRIFNNDKNKLQANRFPENRYTYGLGTTSQINPANSFRVNKTIPDVTETGVLLESGYPVFSQEHSYYGQFFEVDKYDTSIRVDGKYNKTQGNNGTCYSKKASLSVYPDCITQYSTRYKECNRPEKQITNMISRLAIVYRGCNFDDGCTYSESGHPYFAPTGVEDLRKGLAGQEIYMYINLSTVWGPQTKPQDVCGCGPGPVPEGLEDPVFMEVPSPVTFPSFPKFDLHPEEYGCRDPIWQLKYSMDCESGTYPQNCGAPSSLYACNSGQPYTTYGFIRNLCGNEYHDRREVITSAFADLVQAGDYRNTGVAPTDPQPMYWQFNNPYTLESGQVGGFSASGNYPFWGVSDSQGRVVSPYFRPKPAIAYGLACDGPPIQYPYLDFDLCSTRQNGWPKDAVPFLVEIDHDDSCVGCASALMDSEILNLSLTGLDTQFSHAPQYRAKYGYSQSPAQTNRYGFSHCRYSGPAIDPVYSCESGYSPPCDTNSDTDFIEPYTGNTCGCMNQDVQLYASKFVGTDKIIGWSSRGTKNSFVKMSGCDQSSANMFLNNLPYQETFGLSVYGSFKLACDDQLSYLEYPPIGSGGGRTYWFGYLQDSTPIGKYFATSSCSLKYPSSDSDLKLHGVFALVSTGYESLFETIPDSYLLPGRFYKIDLETEDPLEIATTLFEDNVFGCPTYMTEYGCAVASYGSGLFVPCVGCGPEILACDCAGIECTDCGKIISYNGIPTATVPRIYFTPCGCDCNAAPMRTWKREAGVTTLVESFEASPSCSGAAVYVTYSGEYGTFGPIYMHEQSNWSDRDWAKNPTRAISSSACSWHTGPNALAENIRYELTIPKILTKSKGGTCSTLMPPMCEEGTCEDPKVNLGSCLDPIPGTGNPTGISVNKRACYPEMMVVNKIECLASGFRLYVDREYHSHSRAWEDTETIGTPPNQSIVCVPVQKGAYRYGSECVAIPFATPSDGVTPAYYRTGVNNESDELIGYRGVCSTHPSSGQFVTQDFVFGPNPVASGEDTLWNYFNIFYESSFPSNKYHPAIHLGDPDPEAVPPDPEDACANGTVISSGTILNTGDYAYPASRYGVDATNQKHSCLQDYTECGGDLFCNKLFFPRKKYNVGTKITKFGALQLCVSDSTRGVADWYTGYQDFVNSNGSFREPDIYLEIENSKFIDPCDVNAYTTLGEDVAVDDTTLIVADYLPLMGIYENTFRYTIDSKSCIIVNDSCLSSWVPTHSEMSINAGVHAPKTFTQDNKVSFGYYLDKTTTLASDNCLFNPFKIMVDVECCSSNIRTTPYGDPTNLEYVLQGVPSWMCGGFTRPPIGCSYCQNSICGNPKEYFYDAPTPTCVDITVGVAITAALSEMPYYEGSCTFEECPPTGEFSMRPGIADNGYFGADLDVLGFINPGSLSPSPEVAMGSGDPIGLIGCYCYDDGTLIHWANDIGGAVGCSGLAIIGGTTITTGAYECGEYLYIPSVGGTGVSPTLYTTCCIPKSLCETLLSCWKIAKNSSCLSLRKSDAGDYSGDLEDCPQCRTTAYYDACDDSVLRAVITEVM